MRPLNPFSSLFQLPTSRRSLAAAALLFAGATAGFTLAFRGAPSPNSLPPDAPRPFRVVDGRVFVARANGDVLAVRRAPRDARTFVLAGDGGSYALRLKRSVKVEGVSEDELLTKVFGSRAWEGALEPLEPGR